MTFWGSPPPLPPPPAEPHFPSVREGEGWDLDDLTAVCPLGLDACPHPSPRPLLGALNTCLAASPLLRALGLAEEGQAGVRPVGAEETLGGVRALPHTNLVTAVTSFPTEESFSRTRFRPRRVTEGRQAARAPSAEHRPRRGEPGSAGTAAAPSSLTHPEGLAREGGEGRGSSVNPVDDVTFC